MHFDCGPLPVILVDVGVGIEGLSALQGTPRIVADLIVILQINRRILVALRVPQLDEDSIILEHIQRSLPQPICVAHSSPATTTRQRNALVQSPQACQTSHAFPAAPAAHLDPPGGFQHWAGTFQTLTFWNLRRAESGPLCLAVSLSRTVLLGVRGGGGGGAPFGMIEVQLKTHSQSRRCWLATQIIGSSSFTIENWRVLKKR